MEFNSGQSAVAIKNVTLAEEHLHDHFPGFPIMPECLMIEAMAQTAGILVGEARNFEEKVILAKIKKCVFYHYVRPGDTITLHAEIDSIAPEAKKDFLWQQTNRRDKFDVQPHRQKSYGQAISPRKLCVYGHVQIALDGLY